MDDAERFIPFRVRRGVRGVASDVEFYELEAWDSDAQKWGDACLPDPDGQKLALVFEGVWDAQRAAFDVRRHPGAVSVFCTAGVVAKCVKFGYKPWASARDTRSLSGFHAACTRMLRADYCGDGNPHTRNGTKVDIYDLAGIQSRTPDSGLRFEAAWGPQGALCLAKTRIPGLYEVEQARRECPRLAEGGEPGACDPDSPAWRGQALIFNDS